MNQAQDPPSAPLSFERDVRPLFRDKDRTSMLRAFDPWSHADVVAHQDAILTQVRSGHMPCDGAWPPEQTAVLSPVDRRRLAAMKAAPTGTPHHVLASRPGPRHAKATPS